VLAALRKVDGTRVRFYDNETGRILDPEQFLSWAEGTYGLEANPSRPLPKRTCKPANYDIGSPNVPRKSQAILHPLFPSGQLILMFADTRVGKTWLALSIAHAFASGKRPFQNKKAWKPDFTGKVVYVNGDISEADLNSRVLTLERILGPEASARVARMAKPGGYLSTAEGCQGVDEVIEDNRVHEQPCGEPVKLLVLDNYSSLVNCDGDSKKFGAFFEWVRCHREKGMTVLLLDHERGGKPKGSGLKLDLFNHVIHLTKEPVKGFPKQDFVTENWNALKLEIAKGAPDMKKLNPVIGFCQKGRNRGWWLQEGQGLSDVEEEKHLKRMILEGYKPEQIVAQFPWLKKDRVKQIQRKLRDEDKNFA
jgi:hypothetical protein